ncbi:MAG: hypothetical protein PSN44_03415 [Gammaproteobacteria bacterium]|nr:hypothetical protein [Gammaproteobacteria bacterium]
MKTINFPYIALGLSAFLLLVVMRGSVLNSEGVTSLPLLTLLVISEFSFFVTAIGVYIGAHNIKAAGIKSVYTVVTLLCLVLSIQFMLLGIKLWPL